MASPVHENTIVIRPADDLLDQHPAIKRAAAELADAYATRKLVSDDDLEAIGAAIATALALKPKFEAAVSTAGNAVTSIVIESANPAIQQLPWETLYIDGFGFVARDKRFSLSRRIPAIPCYRHAPGAGPLRILLFTAITEDQSRLNVEEEQASVQEALMPWIEQGVVQLEIPDDGRFSTFGRTLNAFQPHAVFLSGHGEYRANTFNDNAPVSVFLFEAEHGMDSHGVDQSTLANAIHGMPIECIVLSSCQSGKGSSDSLTSGLMTRLAALGIPHVIGMRESIRDDAGIRFARTFCGAIARRERIDVAIQAARQSIRKPHAERHPDPLDARPAEPGHGQWCLPALISNTPERPLIDWDFTPRPPERVNESVTLNSITLPARFIGRRRQLRAWSDRLRERGFQQLLITGPGGQGKTALAGRFARKLEEDGHRVIAWSARPESRWRDFEFELECLLGPDRLKQFYAMTERHEDEASRVKLMLRFLQAVPGGLVIFFDNLESLQDPMTRTLKDTHLSHWIQRIQAERPGFLTLIVTSRWKLPEWPDDSHLSLRHLGYNDYLQLARQHRLPRTLLDDPDRLRRIHRTLHGNARALEFFVAAIRDMEAGEESTFLQALADSQAESQTDMALAEVYRHRGEEERELLARLTVYDTPVPLEGVVRIGRDLKTAPAPLLERLVDVSLVEPSRTDDLDCMEYQCSALVSDWLARQRPRPTAARTLTAAAQYQHYLFRHQRPTLEQAMRAWRALVRANQTRQAHRLALDHIVGPLNRAGQYKRILNDWLPAIRRSDAQEIRAEALGQSGKQHFHLGNYSAALGYLKQSLAIQQEIGDKAGEGTTLNNLSQIHATRGDYDTALDYLKQSLAIQQEIGDRSGESATLNNLSQIYDARGDYDIALDYLKQSLAIQQEIGDKAGEGATLNNLSQIHAARGDYDTALDYLKQSLAIRQEIGDRSGEGTTLNNLSQIYDARGDYDTALGYLKQSLAIQQEIGGKAGEGTTLNNLSQIYKARGDHDTALDYLKQSLAIRQEIGDTAGLCVTLFNIGHIHLQNEEREAAVSAWISVYRLASKMNLAPALDALKKLAPQLGLEGGLDGWKKLATRAQPGE
ncbi:MAG TPA: tetratricopeptide repeat protein [Gammaproteobacteria bacterium]|nr:tetratricopeptide repeat protein [Gammaproteobacteria bacterium]